jgi:hypothetical protein
VLPAGLRFETTIVVAAAEPPQAWRRTYRITGVERVSVPAGDFDAVSVTYVEENADDPAQRAEGTLWLARDLGLLRMEESAEAVRRVRELVEVHHIES